MSVLSEARLTFWDRLKLFFGSCSCTRSADIVRPGSVVVNIEAAPSLAGAYAGMVTPAAPMVAEPPVPAEIEAASAVAEAAAVSTSSKFTSLAGMVESTCRIPTRLLTGQVSPLPPSSRAAHFARICSAPTPSLLASTPEFSSYSPPAWMTVRSNAKVSTPSSSSSSLSSSSEEPCAKLGLAVREFGTLRAFLAVNSVRSYSGPAAEFLNR
eukprot:TRINITY_DN11261_c0_g1_i4.p1 TRINITY_DN11261_c0_g1~~TRINITY_DN11261_c0_g1_i4.p1  ORF type:complete len:221 (+),score=37.56 TRINITY_DN11261_c0_g1_i4:31-663(+)